MGRPLSFDWTGKRKEKILVLKRIVRPGQRSMYLIRCDCGTEKEMSGDVIRRSRTCGCERTSGRARLTHGHARRSEKRSKTYKIWLAMRHRCNYPESASYARYGAVGVKVCKRWDESFDNFLADMGEVPSSKHTIDRISRKKGYQPSNCRWATYAEQAQNQERTVANADMVRLIRESSLPQARLADLLGVSTTVVWAIKHGKTWKNIK